VCGAWKNVYYQRSRLIDYEKMHTGGKQYSFDVCVRLLAQSISWKNHTRTQNGEKSRFRVKFARNHSLNMVVWQISYENTWVTREERHYRQNRRRYIYEQMILFLRSAKTTLLLLFEFLIKKRIFKWCTFVYNNSSAIITVKDCLMLSDTPLRQTRRQGLWRRYSRAILTKFIAYIYHFGLCDNFFSVNLRSYVK